MASIDEVSACIHGKQPLVDSVCHLPKKIKASHDDAKPLLGGFNLITNDTYLAVTYICPALTEL